MSVFQKTAKTFEGQKVREGSKVYFIDSDGTIQKGEICRRESDIVLTSAPYHLPRAQKKYKQKILKAGTLYFWNCQYLITDYVSLRVLKY